MSDVCETPDDYDGYLNHLLEHIVIDGYTVMHVTGDQTHPSYSHTLGLTGLGHAEILVTGYDAATAGASLHRVAHDVAFHGLRLRAGPALDGGFAFYLLPITAASRRLHTAVELFGPGVTGLQLIWRNGDGFFPWELGFDDTLPHQPLLGRIPPRRELARPPQLLAPPSVEPTGGRPRPPVRRSRRPYPWQSSGLPGHRGSPRAVHLPESPHGVASLTAGHRSRRGGQPVRGVGEPGVRRTRQPTAVGARGRPRAR